MDIPAWVWFVIAAVAAVAGVLLLLRERAGEGGTNRERSRWAALRGWQYIEADEQLLDHWAGGAIAYYPEGSARDVVVGSTFTANGRRPVYVADSAREGVTDFVLVAVRCRRRLDAYLELWLPSVPFQREQMPDLLGPVGQRYAFVSDVEATRPLITSDLADAGDQMGNDVNVVWLEGYWVVAAAPPNCPSARLERLLRDLGELADLVDPFEEDNRGAHNRPDAPAQQQPPQQQPAQQQPQRSGATVTRIDPLLDPTDAPATGQDTEFIDPAGDPATGPAADPATGDTGTAPTADETELADTHPAPDDRASEDHDAEPPARPAEPSEPVAGRPSPEAPSTQDVPAPPWQRAKNPD